jgi:hypothetical protein
VAQPELGMVAGHNRNYNLGFEQMVFAHSVGVQSVETGSPSQVLEHFHWHQIYQNMLDCVHPVLGSLGLNYFHLLAWLPQELMSVEFVPVVLL